MNQINFIKLSFELYIIILLLTFIDTYSIQPFTNINSLNAKKIDDIKIEQNGSIMYITMIDQKNSRRFSKYNLSTIIPTLINDYIQPAVYNVTAQKIFFYSKNVIGTYSSSATNYIAFKNNGSFLYHGATQNKFKKVISSTKHQKIYYTTIQNKLFYVDYSDFIKGNSSGKYITQLDNVISINFEKTLDQQFISYGPQYFYDERNIQISRIPVYQINSPFRIRYITPQQIRLIGGYYVTLSSWKKDNQILYSYYRPINKLCMNYYSYSNSTCINYNFNGTPVYIKYSSLYNKLIIYSISYPNQTATNIYISFLNSDKLISQQQKSYVLPFYLTDVQFHQQQNSIYILQYYDLSINFNIISSCDITTSYYDTCYHKCMIFHKYCLNKTVKGCNCLFKQDPVQTVPESQSSYSTRQILQGTLNNQVTGTANKFPGVRTIFKPLCGFFLNFGDLWLYTYHPRKYNSIIQQTFKSINSLQQQKWNTLDLKELWLQFTPNFTDFQKSISSKYKFTNFRFLQIQNQSSQFFVNTLNFLFPNMIFTFIMFLVFRSLFFQLITSKASIMFIKFSFWSYFIAILLQGNLQYFSYLIGFQLRYFFQINYIHKMSSSFLLFIFFLIILFSSTCYYLYRYFYKNKAVQFFENVKYSNMGTFYLVNHKGIRYIFLGLIHMMVNTSYSSKIISLFFLQVYFLINLTFTLTQRKILLTLITFWVDLCNGLLRLILIGMFYFEQNVQQADKQKTVTTVISSNLIILYIGCCVISIIIELIKQLFSILIYLQLRLIQQLQNKNKEEDIKQNNGKIQNNRVGIIQSKHVTKISKKINHKVNNKQGNIQRTTSRLKDNQSY